ncbi:hypothetical protein [Paracoccus alkenifer]|uniref:Lipopolysaccharide export system protein LptC n=1 Tax=Paracoccus alkenifer TaxID=65735 RepID=A0A1H6MWV2_9RHOB|nr:hypothetical protein [Paracoccus alkenifer]SEI04127.1 lipopolysaccharide export system protein LptC [Paracoccus alkenifer]
MLRTRVVRLLRVALPLSALALLSVLFLLGRSSDTVEPAIPYAEGTPEDLGRSPGIGAPEYTTVTPDGASVTLRAARAALGNGGSGNSGTASALVLDWRARDGLMIELTSPLAQTQDTIIRLEGGVRMALSSGWVMRGPSFQADTAADTLRADETVHVTAPFGELEAGTMLIHPSDTGQVLELNEGVRLLYRP